MTITLPESPISRSKVVILIQFYTSFWFSSSSNNPVSPRQIMIHGGSYFHALFMYAAIEPRWDACSFLPRSEIASRLRHSSSVELVLIFQYDVSMTPPPCLNISIFEKLELWSYGCSAVKFNYSHAIDNATAGRYVSGASMSCSISPRHEGFWLYLVDDLVLCKFSDDHRDRFVSESDRSCSSDREVVEDLTLAELDKTAPVERCRSLSSASR